MQNISSLIDTFGRVHNYLRISLTERCNLRCFYCMPEEGIPLRNKAELMRSEEVIELAQIFVNMGVKKIRLTGGEPLIKKDIEHVLAQLGKMPVELALTTNGILVDHYLEVFKSSGLKKINVSLDSLHSDKFEYISKRNYFKKILSNINLLIQNQFEVKINVVLIKGLNDNEIIDFIEWTACQPIQIRFIEYMPFNGNRWEWNKKVSFNEIMEQVKNKFGSVQIKKIIDPINDTAKSYRINNYCGTFGIISSVTQPFCDTCNRIRLTADGKIKNCLFSTAEIDLLTALRNKEDLENLIRQSISQKKMWRAGIDSFQNPDSKIHFENNRNMVSIGG